MKNKTKAFLKEWLNESWYWLKFILILFTLMGTACGLGVLLVELFSLAVGGWAFLLIIVPIILAAAVLGYGNTTSWEYEDDDNE